MTRLRVMTTTSTTATALPFTTGEPNHNAGLTLVPLFPAAEPRLEYLGLGEALSRGLTVTEVDADGDVGTLHVKNPLDERVLLYEGEELVGAKQNRVVRVTTLVEAHAVIQLVVDCVERGRWAWRSRAFGVSPRSRSSRPRSPAATTRGWARTSRSPATMPTSWRE